MSFADELRSDLKRNSKTLTTQIENGLFKGEVAKHLRDTLWPFLESIVDAVVETKKEQEEMAEAVDELIQQSEDILQEDTAKELKECIGTGVALAAVLDKLLDKFVGPADPEYAALKSQISAFVILAAQKAELIDQITIIDDDDDDADEGEADVEGDETEDSDDAEDLGETASAP